MSARAATDTIALAGPVPVPVLVVDDSLVARAILSRMVDAVPGFRVAAAVATAEAALAFLTVNRVGIVLLDIEMPGMTGLAALPDIVTAAKGARILVVSSLADRGAAASVQALALGAAATLAKPGLAGHTGRFSDDLAEELRRLVGDQPCAEPPGQGTMRPIAPAALDGATFRVVGIGASTGGIHALSAVLRAISRHCTVPILVTQHLPPSFSGYFAAQLALLAGRPCDIAEDRMRLQPGRVVIAPGDAHMVVVRMTDGHALRLSREPVPSRCVPSVDPMLRSLAATFGGDALGVLLSGMGKDGAEGARALADAGGCVVAQDRDSSVVWGMPGAISSFASAILPPDAIGKLIERQGRRAA